MTGRRDFGCCCSVRLPYPHAHRQSQIFNAIPTNKSHLSTRTGNTICLDLDVPHTIGKESNARRRSRRCISRMADASDSYVRSDGPIV